MTRAGWPRWLPARDTADPDVHLVLSPRGVGACGVAVRHVDVPGEPATSLRCAVCAAVPAPVAARRAVQS